MPGEAIRNDKHYTYADYLTWDDDRRCELIDGAIYMLSAPAWEHQAANVAIVSALYNFLRGNPCQVFHAPFDVRLNAGQEDDTVVQPDVHILEGCTIDLSGVFANGAL